MRALFFPAALLTMACASACVHPVPLSWRLSNNLLIPPGISAATQSQRTVKADSRERAVCPAGVRSRHNQVYVKVHKNTLTGRDPGWLSAWTSDLEARGCIEQGEGFRLARRIAQSLPLEANAAFRLLYPRDPNVVELDPGVRLQVMVPIMASGAAPDAPIVDVKTTVNGNTVSIDGRFTENLLCYETTSYSVQSRSKSPGVTVTPISTERHIDGHTQRVSQPMQNYFQTLGPASFYALFYKGGETEFTALIVGGVTKADLDRRRRLLETGVASCGMLNNEMCVAVPKRVAINPMVMVTVNGEEKFLSWGSTVGAALRDAGVRQLNAVLPGLSVLKPYGERPTSVEFNPTDSAILNLILMGGEIVSWK